MKETTNKSTLVEDSPVFDSWATWYVIVIVSNLIMVSLVYFFFKGL